jgi:hypothetical protein
LSTIAASLQIMDLHVTSIRKSSPPKPVSVGCYLGFNRV